MIPVGTKVRVHSEGGLVLTGVIHSHGFGPSYTVTLDAASARLQNETHIVVTVGQLEVIA